MAIIDNYTVNILINGQPCMESGGPESGRGAKKVIRYIEAISDAPYEICLEILPSVEIPTEAVAFKISIDGDEVCRMIVISDQRRYRKIISRIPIRGVDHSFYFIDIKRTKGESLLDPYISDDKLKRIGTILVEVYQCHISKQIPTRVPAQPPHLKLLQTQRKIPEEKIKELSLTSLTHSTRFVELNSGDRREYVHGTHGDTQSLTQLSLEKPQALLSIPRALPIRSKACMEEHLNVTTMQQPNKKLPFRPSTHPLLRPIMEEPPNAAKIQEPNIQKYQEVSITEERSTTVIGRRKREHRDEGEPEEEIGKSRKLSKAFKPSDPCGEDDMGSRTKSQRHPHPRNPRADTHRGAGN